MSNSVPFDGQDTEAIECMLTNTLAATRDYQTNVDLDGLLPTMFGPTIYD